MKKEGENPEFDPLLAACDLKYLFAHADEAKVFADRAMNVEDPGFVQALKIKGVLGDRVDVSVLREALGFDRACRDEVLFYLSKVRVPELCNAVIALINAELEKEGNFDNEIYWMIRALKTMGMSSAEFYLSELNSHPKIVDDPVAMAAFA